MSHLTKFMEKSQSVVAATEPTFQTVADQKGNVKSTTGWGQQYWRILGLVGQLRVLVLVVFLALDMGANRTYFVCMLAIMVHLP